MAQALPLDDLLVDWLSVEASGVPIEFYLECLRHGITHEESIWAWDTLRSDMAMYYTQVRKTGVSHAQAKETFARLSAKGGIDSYCTAMAQGIAHTEYFDAHSRGILVADYLECRDAGITHSDLLAALDQDIPIDEYYGARSAGLNQAHLLDAARTAQTDNGQYWQEGWEAYVNARLAGVTHAAALATLTA